MGVECGVATAIGNLCSPTAGRSTQDFTDLPGFCCYNRISYLISLPIAETVSITARLNYSLAGYCSELSCCWYAHAHIKAHRLLRCLCYKSRFVSAHELTASNSINHEACHSTQPAKACSTDRLRTIRPAEEAHDLHKPNMLACPRLSS